MVEVETIIVIIAGAVIVNVDNINPDAATTAETEYTTISMTTIRLRYFFTFNVYSSMVFFSLVRHSHA